MSWQGLPNIPGNEESEKAARSMIEAAKNQRHAIWLYLRYVGAECATCDEVEIALGMHHGSCSTRILELRKMGRAVDSGKRRLTRSKREAAAWRCVERMFWTDSRPNWPCPEYDTERQQLKRRVKYLEELLEWNGIDHE